MRDFVNIGSVPAGEGCAQVGSENYYNESKMECKAFINQLKRVHGEPPAGARFKVQSNAHEFGTYYEVVCEYVEENEEASNYAWGCEKLPEEWDKEAIQELKSQGYSFPTQGGSIKRF